MGALTGLPNIWWDRLVRILTRGTPANRLLRFGLTVEASAWSVLVGLMVARQIPIGVDFEIPLRAASRWAAGAVVYDPSSLLSAPGPNLPYLYPPYILPLLVPFLSLPRALVIGAWFLACLLAGIFACRRLGFTWHWVGLLLLWPPFLEGLLDTNVQVVTFAAYATLLSPLPTTVPEARGIASRLIPARPRWLLSRGVALEGFLSAMTAGVKVTQPHVLLYLARTRPQSAAIGCAVLVSLAVLTLPLVGLPLWADWIEQLRRAADPTWTRSGASLGHVLPPEFALAVVGACLVAVVLVPARTAREWVGILVVLGAPSFHAHALLFLLPSLRYIRLEIAIVAWILAASNTEDAWLAAIMLVALCQLLADRYPCMRETLTLSRPQGQAVAETAV